MARKLFTLTVLGLCFGLSGCSSEPGQSDISKAVKDYFKNDSSILSGNKLIGIMATATGVEGFKLDSVDKIGCEPSGKNAYICEVSVEYTINSTEGSLADLFGAAGQKRSINKYRFVKTSNGWLVATGNN